MKSVMKIFGNINGPSSPRRRAFWIPAFAGMTLCLCCLLLSGCGFHSVYGSHSANGSTVSEELNKVAIDPIPEHVGQQLRNDLIDRFYGKGRPSQPLYHLSVKIGISEEDLGLLVNATAALAAVHVNGAYVLTDANGTELIRGDVTSSATYDKLTSQYGTLAARDSAVERTAREVSEQITARLSLYFAERPATSP